MIAARVPRVTWQPTRSRVSEHDDERERLDQVSALSLNYPYRRQAATASDRLSPADLSLLGPHIG